MSLFEKLLKGSIWLFFREIANIIIRIFGVFLIIKVVTPEQYGVYAISVAIASCIAQVSSMGINIHIVKYSGDIKEVLSSFSSFSFYVTVLVTVLAYLLIPVFAIITHVNWVIFAIIFITIPVTILGFVPMGIIERQIDYKEISKLEIFCQVIYYVTALSLIYLKIGVWALVIGSVIMSITYFFGLVLITKYTLTFNNFRYFKEIKKFGINYSFTNVSYQTKSLILPFIIAPLTNPGIVGTIALAIRITDSLNAFKISLGRISIRALSTLQNDRYNFINAVKNAMSYQVIVMGLFLIVFVLLSPPIVSLFLGKKWCSIIPLIPFLAFNTLCSNLIIAQVSALTIKEKNHTVALNFLFQQILLLVGLYLFLPKYSVTGYGYAILISAPAYLLLSYTFFKIYKEFNPLEPLLWFVPFSIALICGHLNSAFFSLIFLPLLLPRCRDQFSRLFNSMYKTFRVSSNKIITGTNKHMES